MEEGARLADVVTAADRADSYRAAGLWDGATLAGQVAKHAVAQGEATAVVDGEGRHTYAELAADAACLAAFLRSESRVSRGSVVSVQLPNRYEAVVAAVAIQSLGAVVNPLLPGYRHKELAHVFTTAQPLAIITPSVYRGFDHRPLVDEVSAATGVHPTHVVNALDLGPRDHGPLGHGDAAAVSELIFTSGTEAVPKGIMHTEQTAGFSVRTAYTDLGLSPDDVVWMASPVGHSTGFNYGVRLALHHGVKLVLQDYWDPAAAGALVKAEQCTYTLAATTFLQDLVDAGTSLPSLRYFGCGGAPVPSSLVLAAAELGIGVLRLYGSTEVHVATWNRADSPMEKRAGTDGPAMSHVELDVRDGELFTRGPNTCVGYYADPDRTAATFADGWVRSGDLVTIDADDYLTVVGRKKEIIIRGGMNIAPREIEEMLVAFPEVERAAVVGLPDTRLGERMCACVILHPDADLDLATVVERLKGAGLATYKLPERLEVLDALPMTGSGKVQKHEIVRQLVRQ
jgi:acyl-CoA synthetase (AMP-forming)/AMP-acid ligase II